MNQFSQQQPGLDLNAQGHAARHPPGGLDSLDWYMIFSYFGFDAPAVFSPVRGDIITAQGSPAKWTRLAASIPGSAGLMNVLSFITGTTEPVWRAAEHALLSVRHSDTLADAVVDGDVIIGNVTPKWSRLARSVPGSAGLMNVLGIANGETRPSWKAAEHALLSIRHSDTLAAAVARGDIVYGNSTPAWARLAQPASPAFLGSDGTDVAWNTGVWAAWTPTYSASGGGSLTTVTGSGRFLLIGKILHLSLTITVTDIGTGIGFLQFTLPNSQQGAALHILAGRENAVVGLMLQAVVYAGNNKVDIFTYANGSTLVNGYSLIISGVCEVQ